MTISELAEVTSGLHVSPSEPNAEGYKALTKPITYLQLSDFNNDGQKIPDKPPTYLHAAPQQALKRLLEPGQVLLPSKGARFISAAILEEWLPALASPSFFVLTLRNPEICLPEFLALILNLPETREELRARIRTTTIPTLNRGDLLEMPLLSGQVTAIPYWPTIRQQKQAVELHSLWLKEKDLATRYLQTREQFIYNFITNSIKP